MATARANCQGRGQGLSALDLQADTGRDGLDRRIFNRVDFRPDDYRALERKRLDDVVRAMQGEAAARHHAVGQGDVEVHFAE